MQVERRTLEFITFLGLRRDWRRQRLLIEVEHSPRRLKKAQQRQPAYGDRSQCSNQQPATDVPHRSLERTNCGIIGCSPPNDLGAKCDQRTTVRGPLAAARHDSTSRSTCWPAAIGSNELASNGLVKREFASTSIRQ